MNSKNKMLVGCLALLLVLSVGYALFSDTITINGTATAKGDFAYEIECIPGISDELYGNVIAPSPYGWSDSNNGYIGKLTRDIGEFVSWYPEGGYSNDLCNVSGNKVSFSTEFEVPGARRYFTIKMTNTGSIPIVPEYNYIYELIEDATLSVDAAITSNGNVQNKTLADFSYSIMNGEAFAYIIGQAYDVADPTGLAAQTGDSLYLVITLHYPEELRTSDGMNTYNYADSVELDINYEVNVPIKQVTN